MSESAMNQAQAPSANSIIPVGTLNIAAMELSLHQVRDLFRDILSDLKTGNFEQERAIDGRSYFDMPPFKSRVRKIRSGDIAGIPPEFAIDESLVVKTLQTDVITDIEHVLQELSQERSSPFSRRRTVQKIWDSLDWTSEKKKEIVQHLTGVQGEYILSPDNAFLLQSQTQEDVADIIEVTASTVWRLLKSLRISFPDGNVRHAGSLVPACRIYRIKGQYALELLKQDPDFFDPSRGWLKSVQSIADEIGRRFDLHYARRTLHKYIAKMGDKKDYGKKKQEIVEEIDALLEQFMHRDDLFDVTTQTWRFPATKIRRIIRDETGVVIPKQWITCLRFENCVQFPENLYKRVRKEK